MQWVHPPSLCMRQELTLRISPHPKIVALALLAEGSSSEGQGCASPSASKFGIVAECPEPQADLRNSNFLIFFLRLFPESGCQSDGLGVLGLWGSQVVNLHTVAVVVNAVFRTGSHNLG